MIGEMFDLERLCETSQKLGRSTCFVSSVPLKVCLFYSMPPWCLSLNWDFVHAKRLRVPWCQRWIMHGNADNIYRFPVV